MCSLSEIALCPWLQLIVRIGDAENRVWGFRSLSVANVRRRKTFLRNVNPALTGTKIAERYWSGRRPESMIDTWLSSD